MKEQNRRRVQPRVRPQRGGEDLGVRRPLLVRIGGGSGVGKINA